MTSLDLLVAIHADPDHDLPVPIEDSAFRLTVDELLTDIVDGDCFGLCDGVETLTLAGPWDRRTDAVSAYANGLGNRRPVSQSG